MLEIAAEGLTYSELLDRMSNLPIVDQGDPKRGDKQRNVRESISPSRFVATYILN